MGSRLQKAAIEGNVTILRELLQQDPLLLDRINLNDFSETPLHVAALLDHRGFVNEILQLKPQLVKELDSEGSSPLHFAAAKGHLEIARSLLHVDSDICFVCNKDGRNPLHLAAMKGRVDVLAEFIRARPSAARAVVDDGGTILHLCVKNYQLEALKMLIQKIDDNSFLNAKDDYGFTILHLAVSNKQIETVEYLVNNTEIEVNALNSNGFTALDILFQTHKHLNNLNIAETLRSAAAFRTTNTKSSSSSSSLITRNPRPKTPTFRASNLAISQNQTISFPSNKELRKFINGDGNWLSKKRDSLMVVASLIATMAFQAGVNPPGGVWQANEGGHKAGRSVMADEDQRYYSLYLLLNTAGFTASLSVIFMLVSGLPFKHPFFLWILTITMWIAITSVALTYGISIKFFTPQTSEKTINQISFFASIVVCCVVGLVLLGKMVQALSHMLRKMNNYLWRGRLPTR